MFRPSYKNSAGHIFKITKIVNHILTSVYSLKITKYPTIIGAVKL